MNMWEFKELFPFWLNLISEFDLISHDKEVNRMMGLLHPSTAWYRTSWLRLTFLRSLIYDFNDRARFHYCLGQATIGDFRWGDIVYYFWSRIWDIPCCDGRLTFRDAGSSAAVITFVRYPVVGEPSEAIEQGILWVSVTPQFDCLRGQIADSRKSTGPLSTRPAKIVLDLSL